MNKKPTKILGLTLDKFEELITKGNEIHLQPAKLIPFHKPGDEMALTSIFLSGLRLIKEFRDEIFQILYVNKTNKILIFTEIEFVLFDKRIDGLILIIRSNKIYDAVLLEVKNKRNDLELRQIEEYLKISKEYGIPKFLTVSNQFVSFQHNHH